MAPTTTRFSFHLRAFLNSLSLPPKQSNRTVKYLPDQAKKKKKKGRKNTKCLQEAFFFLWFGVDQWSGSDHIKDDAVNNLPQTWSDSFSWASKLFNTSENISAQIQKWKTAHLFLYFPHEVWGAVCSKRSVSEEDGEGMWLYIVFSFNYWYFLLFLTFLAPLLFLLLE